MCLVAAGDKEVRCWTIPAGALAPQAAGVIHNDFERGFIKAEVVAFEDFKSLSTGKGMNEVKAAGKYRQEGKLYEVQDGDIIHFQCRSLTLPLALMRFPVRALPVMQPCEGEVMSVGRSGSVRCDLSSICLAS